MLAFLPLPPRFLDVEIADHVTGLSSFDPTSRRTRRSELPSNANEKLRSARPRRRAGRIWLAFASSRKTSST